MGNSINSTLQELYLENATGDSSLVAWDINTIPLNVGFGDTPMWSPYPGETSILYAVCHDQGSEHFCQDNNAQNWLITYNVDSGDIVKIISVTDVTNAISVVGFTDDVTTNNFGHGNELIIAREKEEGTNNIVYRVRTGRSVDGEGNVIYDAHYCNSLADTICNNNTLTKIFSPGSCERAMLWYPQILGVHAGTTPDGLYKFHEYAVFKNDFEGGECAESTINSGAPPYRGDYWAWNYRTRGELSHGYTNLGLTHVTADGSNDWWIAANNGKKGGNTQYEPYVREKESIIAQVLFDRDAFENVLSALPEGEDCNDGNKSTRSKCRCDNCTTAINNLIVRTQAGGWRVYNPTKPCTDAKVDCPEYAYDMCVFPNGSGYCGHSVYGNLLMPHMANDASLLKFKGTAKGKYSRDDKGWCLYQPSACTSVTIGNNWDSAGNWLAELDYVGDSTPPEPIFDDTDINIDGRTDINDVRICMNSIIDIANPYYYNCSKIALPDNVADLNDIKTILIQITR